MPQAFPTHLNEAVAAMAEKRSARREIDPELDCALTALEAKDITTSPQLDELTAAADWLDWACFTNMGMLEAVPFILDVLVRFAFKDVVVNFGKVHGPNSALTYVLFVFCGVAIPAILCTVVEANTRILRPRYTVAQLPDYARPGLGADGSLHAVFHCVVECVIVINDAQDSAGWWHVLAAPLSAALQVQASWGNVAQNLRILVGGGRCRQLWIKGTVADISASVCILRRPQVELHRLTQHALRGMVCGLPGSLVGALAPSDCWGTAIALAPSAACFFRAQTEVDGLKCFQLNLLAVICYDGCPGFLFGRTSRGVKNACRSARTSRLPGGTRRGW